MFDLVYFFSLITVAWATCPLCYGTVDGYDVMSTSYSDTSITCNYNLVDKAGILFTCGYDVRRDLISAVYINGVHLQTDGNLQSDDSPQQICPTSLPRLNFLCAPAPQPTIVQAYDTQGALACQYGPFYCSYSPVRFFKSFKGLIVVYTLKQLDGNGLDNPSAEICPECANTCTQPQYCSPSGANCNTGYGICTPGVSILPRLT